jgi:hypothetical protein
MEKQEKLSIIKEIITDTMNENYRTYGSYNNMSDSEVDSLILENSLGVGAMADIVAERISSRLF